MREKVLLVLALAAAPVYGQENEAEKTFGEMEKKLRSAKSMHFEFDTVEGAKGEGATVKGSFDMAEGRAKFRIKSDTTRGDKKLEMLCVADGKATYANNGAFPKPLRIPAARPFNDNHLSLLARAGPITFFNACSAGPLPFAPRLANFEDDINKSLVVKSFKSGSKEKVGDQETHVVHYEVTWGDKKGDAIQSTVWIDTKTLLPVKHKAVFTPTVGGKPVQTEIIFRAFSVDGPTDPKVFELPK